VASRENDSVSVPEIVPHPDDHGKAAGVIFRSAVLFLDKFAHKVGKADV
jgi:hypothetical protein